MKQRWGGLALALGLLAYEAQALTPQCKEAAAQVEAAAFVSPEQAEKLVEFVQLFKMDLIMRPLTEEARELRKGNAHPPKPKTIKWKTCDDDDMKLFSNRENGKCKGLVILYEPEGPEPTDPALRERWKQRKKEWTDYTDKGTYPSSAAGASGGKAVAFLENGFVKDPHTGKAFTGDLDLFDITHPNGYPVAKREMQIAVKKLIGDSDIDVLHGVHMNWAPSAHERHIYEKIIDGHRSTANGGKGKPLVRLGADCTVCSVYAPGVAGKRVESKDQLYPCAPAGPAAEYTHLLLMGDCTKVRITERKGTNFNFDDEKGYQSFIWKEQWAEKSCGAAKTQPWPGGEAEEAPKEKAEYVHLLVSGVCTKVKLTQRNGTNFNFDDEKGYQSFIWKEEWAEKSCGASKLKPWPGGKQGK